MRVRSPGRIYNRIIKGQEEYLGITPTRPSDHPGLKFNPFDTSSWLKGTSYVDGVLIVWTTDMGLVYKGVPPWKVGALHGWPVTREADPVEPTDEELNEQLRASLALQEAV